MQKLHALLQVKNSHLAQLLRYQLYGMRTSLRAALIELPTDPGAAHCEDLLNALESLAGPLPKRPQSESKEAPQIQPSSDLEDVLETISEPQPISPLDSAVQSCKISPHRELRLTSLRQAVCQDLDLRDYLGEVCLRVGDEGLWHDIQQVLLRLPVVKAKSWQQRSLAIAQAESLHPTVSSSYLIPLPYVRDEVIYQGLTELEQPSGLQLKFNAPLDPRVNQGNLAGDLHFLAQVVSICLKFIEINPSSLCHALKSIHRFGLKSLDSLEQRSKYVEALIDRFQRVQRETNSLILLRARLDLDEAIHSLVYDPPADPDSWWGRLQQDARRTLENFVRQLNAQEGQKVKLRSLWGAYADVCELSRDDIRLEQGGIPGDILACLRVYASIDGKELPGRVIYRSA